MSAAPCVTALVQRSASPAEVLQYPDFGGGLRSAERNSPAPAQVPPMQAGRLCAACGEPLQVSGRGRPRRFCGAVCRERAFRRREQGVDESMPAELRGGRHRLDGRRWL